MNIKTSIILNKSDLSDEKTDKILDIYKQINVNIFKTSNKDKKQIKKLKEYVKNKQIILLGQSGVGKSTLTNILCMTNETTGKVSDKTKKGKHTTTETKSKNTDGTIVIDTPGIRSISLNNFNYKDIENYFSEFNAFKGKCRFKDCTHSDESINDCQIKQEVQSGTISKIRYESYLKMIKEIKK